MRRYCTVIIYIITVLGIPALSATAQESAVEKATGQAEPVDIQADRLEYNKDQKTYYAEGRVVVTQGSVRMTADKAEMDQSTGVLHATGHVVLSDGDNTLTAETMDYHTGTQAGLARKARLFLKKDHYTVEGDEIEKLGEDRYRLKTALITSCEVDGPGTPDWTFRAREVRIQVDEYLTAGDAVFSIKKLPVLYTPYLLLPVKRTRQSGLLPPHLGYNTGEGFKLRQPFYWAISESQDATLTLDYRSRLGIGGGLEYRYVISRESRGTLIADYFDNDRDQTRTVDLRYHHVQAFTPRLQARLDIHFVDQIDLFRTLSEQAEERGQRSVESTFVISQRWDQQELYLMARHTKDLFAEVDTTLQRLPEVGYLVTPVRLGPLPFYIEMNSTAVNFWREEEDEAQGLVRAQRVDVFPRLTGNLPAWGWVFSPFAGYRETWYSRTVTSEEPADRGLPAAGGTLTARWSRPYGAARHILQPQLTYEYVPEEDQADLPHFDEVDELPEKNLVTYSLTNRLSLPDRETVMVRLTQSYNLSEVRSNEPGERVRPYSPVRGEVTVRPVAKLEATLDSFYELYDRRTLAVNTDVSYLDSVLKLSLGRRYTPEGTDLPRGDPFNPTSPLDQTFWYTYPDVPLIRFLTGQIRVDTPWGLSLGGRALYDAVEEDYTEVDYGLLYFAGCWAVRVLYQDLPDKNEVSLLFTLRGAGGIPATFFGGPF